jgi:hypothetical protein
LIEGISMAKRGMGREPGAVAVMDPFVQVE